MGGASMGKTMGKGHRMPAGLFVRYPEIEQARGVPLAGLLYLLTRTGDPKHLAEWLAGQLVDYDDVPTDGAVIPLWADEADTWNCDGPTRAAIRAQLAGSIVVGLALEQGEDGARFLYDLVPADSAAAAIDALQEALEAQG